MKKLYVHLLFIAILHSISAQEVSINNPVIDSILNNHISKEIPGLSAAVNIGDTIIWIGSGGVSSSDTEMSLNSLFGIASISKTFLSVLTLKLMEENKLHLNNIIGDYLPHFNHINDSITIEQLLNHTSGLYDPLQNPVYLQTVLDPSNQKVWEPKEILETFVLEPHCEPGKCWKYSNANAILLGLIIEEIEGKPYHNVLREEILKPLKLENTYIFPDEKFKFSEISHYWLDFDGNGVLEDITDSASLTTLCSTVWGGGNIFCDVSDLSRWGYLVFNSKIISDNSIELITSEQILNRNYRYGFIHRKIHGFSSYGHTGGFTHSGEMVYIPEDKVSIVVLSNASVISSSLVMEEIDIIINELYNSLLNMHK